MRKSRHLKILAIALSALLLGWILCGLYNPLSVENIPIRSEKIDRPVRIALITDLHSCRYGDGQAELIDAIRQQCPDLICLAGDIFDDTLPDTNAERLLCGIADLCPCYYVTGNHEYRAGAEAFRAKMDRLERCGIIRLANESRILEVRGQKIQICGVDDPDAGAEVGDGFRDAGAGDVAEWSDDCVWHSGAGAGDELLQSRHVDPALYAIGLGAGAWGGNEDQNVSTGAGDESKTQLYGMLGQNGNGVRDAGAGNLAGLNEENYFDDVPGQKQISMRVFGTAMLNGKHCFDSISVQDQCDARVPGVAGLGGKNYFADMTMADGETRFLDALVRLQTELRDDTFSLLLSHRPEYFAAYARCGFDLTLCGHAHGGQWRVPGLLENGLIAPGQGLFPKYCSGKFTSDGSAMIVSRGLARESTPVPRFFNRPEIVIVELQ